MGWFWGKSAPEKPATPQTPVEAPTAAQSSQTSTSSPNMDPEITKFLEELVGELRNARNETEQSAPPRQPPTQQPPNHASISSPTTPKAPSSSPSASEIDSLKPEQATTAEAFTETQDIASSNSDPTQPRLSPLAESILPTTMDCEQAFNLAFYCQSLGGQWNNLYRYGSVRSCSDHWDDFWFCMRVKSYQKGKVKDDMIREHYRKKHLAKYGGGKPNSEDVWRERRERVPPGTAFSEQVDAPAVSDAEYQRWEMERMERIRTRSAS